MNRKLSFVGLLLIIINGTIGSAWLFAPYYAAKIAGPNSLIAWVLGGAMTILIALTFAETSALIPMNGGTTEVAKYTHGELTAFIISWIAWISSMTIPAIEVQAVLQYASNYFPFLIEKTRQNTHTLSIEGMTVACFLMLLLTIANIQTIKTVLRSNLLILLIKSSVIFLTIFAVMKTQFHTDNFATTTMIGSDSWKTILTALATGGVAFAFVGFKHGVELSGEVLNPKKSVPFAIVGSVFICLLLYVGLQIAFIGSISHHAILNGWQHLSFVGDIGPFSGIAAGLGLLWLVKLLMMDAVVSPMGAASVYVSSTARLTYAMSKNGYFPALFSQCNKNHIPVLAIIFNSFIGCLLFLPLPNWQNMVQFLTSILVISYAMGPIALMSLREANMVQIQKSDYFRLPFAQFLSQVAFYFCNLVSYWTGWETVSKTSIVLVIGFLILLLSKRKNYSQLIASLKSARWLLPYFIGLTTISYFGSFGGKKYIAFGWDFAVIAVFSFLIFYYAVRCSTYYSQVHRNENNVLKNINLI